ncbi:MAG: GNAT family N-acetyltransferase [Clostridiales bacterium]|nr:GNAT family N-acetyltransferase [Clostridiales bacterium]
MDLKYETERLTIMVVRPEAADQVLDFYLRDQELFERYEPEKREGFYTLEGQRQIIALEYNSAVKGKVFRYFVYLKGFPRKIIGTICFHGIEYGYYSRCEIGYKFSSAYQHKGYATEALSFMTERIFVDLKIHRIEAWTLPENAASERLLKRVGFQYEGICRGHMQLHGKWRDHAQYSKVLPC